MARTILVIDDLIFYRRRVRNLLRHMGYVVYEAASGEEGLRVAADVRPDAVLLDQVMPGLGARATLERLRAAGFAGTVILMSPRPEAPEARALMESDVNAVLPKAATPGRIEAALRQAIDAASAA